MILAIALSLHVLQAPMAKDYFPLVKGVRLTYLETGEQALTYIYEVGASKEVGGQTAIPIVIRYKGNPLTTTYYVLSDDTLAIIADDDLSSIYSPPRPVFKISAEPQHWTYSGKVPFDTTTAPLTLTGSCHMGEKRTILGQEVDSLEVTIDATLSPLKKKPIVDHQVAVYGKGIGLIEMTRSVTIGTEKHASHLELVKQERGGTATR
jgi:hypothetical protein